MNYYEDEEIDYTELYYQDEEDADTFWDNYYYAAAFEQQSIVQDYIYDGELLISEIRQQDNQMMVLATNYMLIADIDCGDNIDKPLETLNSFVSKNGGSFRVYKTKNGMRYLQTDLLYQGANKSAIATLADLGSDPQYISLCDRGKRFMARLTPKIQPELAFKYFDDRSNGKKLDMAVCHFLKTLGSGSIVRSLDKSIALHDFVTQSDHNVDKELGIGSKIYLF